MAKATTQDAVNLAQPEAGLSVFSQDARPIGRDEYKRLTRPEIDKAHLYVLSRCQEVQPYLEKHMKELGIESCDNLSDIQQKQFAEWLKNLMKSLRHKESPEATNGMFSLACGPEFMKSYPGCVVKGVCFWIRRDKRLKAPNPGLLVVREHDKEVVDFYGFVTDVVELVYKFGNRVMLFKCEWFNTNPKENKIQKDGNFTSINVSLENKWYENEPFALATEAQQVFFLDDHKFRSNWKLVQKVEVVQAVGNEDDEREANNGDKPDIEQEVGRTTIQQRSTSLSSTTSSHRDTRESLALIKSLQVELDAERALVQGQKVELESRRALTQTQTAELESQRALTQSQNAELESWRALTQTQKAELESQRSLTQSQQLELERQRVLTRCQQTELESTRAVVQAQHQLLQAQQERVKQLEELVVGPRREAVNANGNVNESQSGSSLNTHGVDVADVLARMSTYKRRKP